MRRLGITGLFLSSLALASCSSSNPPSEDAPVSAESAIAYGTADSSHTAVVSLLLSISGGIAECSGTIVQVKNGVGYVLTAAHCCNMGAPSVVVVSNDYGNAIQMLTQGQSPTPPAYAVTAGSVYYDSSYNPASATPDHDFCMLKFPAPAGAAVIPVAQPGQDGVSVGTPVEHVGFGQTDTNANNSGHYAGTAPVDQAVTATILQSSQGGPTHIPGTCEGDSGGPALAPAGVPQAQQKVVGTTSYGNSKTCSQISLGVCSRVTSETGPGGFITNYLADTPSGTQASAGAAACNTCEQTAENGACSTQTQACLNDTKCKTLNTCISGCTTQTCITNCENTAGATAVGELQAVGKCVCAQPCASACSQCSTNTKCGGITTGNMACDTCVDTSCCTQATACAADTACTACLVQNPPASCNSNTHYTGLTSCVSASCASPCSGMGSSSSSSSGTGTGSGTSTSTGTGTGASTSTGTGTGTGSGAGVGGGSSGNGSGGGTVGAHSGCSVAGTSEPEPLAPLAGLLLGAALTFSRRKRG